MTHCVHILIRAVGDLKRSVSQILLSGSLQFLERSLVSLKEECKVEPRGAIMLEEMKNGTTVGEVTASAPGE